MDNTEEIGKHISEINIGSIIKLTNDEEEKIFYIEDFKISILNYNRESNSINNWDICIDDKLGDSHIGIFCVYNVSPDNYIYNLPSVNRLLSGIGITLEIKEES